jgi:hypothetical protein
MQEQCTLTKDPRTDLALDQGANMQCELISSKKCLGRETLKRAIMGLGAVFAVSALPAAGQSNGASATIYTLMTEVVAPQADRLWDVGNRGVNDAGEPDGSALTPQDWTTLADAASRMKEAATSMATAKDYIVAPPGVKISGEENPGATTGQQVQQYIAKDPTSFARHAEELADISHGYLQAAASRDALKLQDTAARMDVVCEGCHKQFWYPEQ